MCPRVRLRLRALESKPLEEKETYTKAELEEISERRARDYAAQERRNADLTAHTKAVTRVVNAAVKMDTAFNTNLENFKSSLLQMVLLTKRQI